MSTPSSRSGVIETERPFRIIRKRRRSNLRWHREIEARVTGEDVDVARETNRRAVEQNDPQGITVQREGKAERVSHGAPILHGRSSPLGEHARYRM
jgi:hypothetical protein